VPVQFRQDILRFQHEPTDHPYRYRLNFHEAPAFEYQYLFPPSCGQVLYTVNLPAQFVRHILADHVLHLYILRWEFSAPVMDQEALEPRRISYVLTASDLVFFVVVVATWYYVGLRIEELLPQSRSKDRTKPPSFRIAELTIISLAALVLFVYCAEVIRSAPILTIGELTITPSFRRIGELGLCWPVFLSSYVFIRIRGELQRFDRNSQFATPKKPSGGRL